MKGIAGDAFIIFFAIIAIAILTVRLWYPLLVRKVNHIKEEIDKAKQDVVESKQQQEEYIPRSMANLTPRQRAEEYKRRAQRAGIV